MMDRGLNLKKLRGSLAKVAARRGMFRYDPLNLDPVAQICWARVLIVTAGHRSDGSGRLGAGRGVCWAARGKERAARFGVGKESGPWAASGWVGL